MLSHAFLCGLIFGGLDNWINFAVIKSILVIKHIFILVCVCLISMSGITWAQWRHNRVKEKKPTYNELIVNKYIDSLAVVVAADSIVEDSMEEAATLNNPYYYPLLITPTMYNLPVKNVMESRWKPSRLSEVSFMPKQQEHFADSARQSMLNIMMWAYTNVPWLISNTQRDIDNAAGIKKDILEAPVKEVTHISPHTEEPIDLGIEDASFKVITRRPNFWKFSGSLNYQMSQYYNSESPNNNSFQLTTSLNANYNNQRGVSFNNNVNAWLWFTSQSKDKKHKYNVTNNRVEMTNTVGLSAVKHWDYTVKLYTWTHIYPKYSSNSDYVTEDFLSPIDSRLSIGMRYSIGWGTKKRKDVFSFSLNLAPLSYHALYCDRKALRNSKGIPGKHHAYNDFGPSADMSYNWKISKNIRAWGDAHYYSNLHYFSVYMNNWISFSINKYLSSQLYYRPDISDNYFRKGERRIFRLQESMSMGLTVNF